MEENKIEDKKINKKVVITLVIALTLLTTLIIGASYAYFRSSSSGTAKTITTGTFKIVFSQGNTVNLTNIVPIKDANVTSKASKSTFSVKNQSGKSSYIDISLSNFNIASEYMEKGELRWALYEGTIPLTTGTFVDATNNTSFPIKSNVAFAANETKTYNLYVWIKETSLDQGNLQGLNASFKIDVNGSQKQRLLLADAILANNEVKTGATFSATSTDEGLYVQKDNISKSEMGFPTYYYKGNVSNNYVQLGIYINNNVNSIYNRETSAYESVTMNTTSSPVLWRIVRINEDGTIRLVQETNARENYLFSTTNGNYVSGSFTRDLIENKWYGSYVGNWSSDPLNNYVQTSVFCNENSTNVESRISTNNPSFVCSNTANHVVHRAGMLNVDDLIFAGLTSTSTNVTSYLDNGGAFWTMTSTGGSGVYNYKSSTYQIGQNGATGTNNAAARGVINLKSNVMITSTGDGTKTNPYVITK